MKQISATTLYSNIKYLAKQNQMKLGELEDKVGVSPGYFSRLSGKDVKNSAIDVLVKLSDTLDVTLDLLLTVDLESRTPTERLVLSFIQRLSSATAQDNLAWRIFSENDLLPSYPDDVNSPDPPEFSEILRNDGTYDIREVNFKSFYDGQWTKLDDDSLIAYDPELGSVYLMKIRTLEDCGFELYLYNNGATDAIACGYQKDGDGFYSSLYSLYNTALEACRHVQLSTRAKEVLQNFLAGKKPINPEAWSADDIPF